MTAATPAGVRLELAGRVLDLVRSAAGTGTQVEVTVGYRELALTRFANSAIHQNVADDTTTVRLRLHRDGRTATGSSTLTGPAALADLVDRTVAAARVSPLDPGWPGLAPPARLPGTGTVDPATAAASPADRAARVRAFVDAAGDLRCAGYVRTVYCDTAFVNSAGQDASGSYTSAALDGVARTGTSDGVARLLARRLSDVDGAVLGARAAAKARACAEPVEVPPGVYEVVLEPTAVADLLSCLAVYGFNGRTVAERRSFFRAGEAQFDPAVSIVDDPVGGLPFDVEGTPKHPLDLVEAGVSRHAVYDRRTAMQAGTASTGHALADAGGFGPVAEQPSLRPAPGGGPVGEVDGPPADSSVADLLVGVHRGILVTDHFYTRCLDPRRLVMTGLTRNGAWLVRDGQIVSAVRNLRFTQSYPQALAPGEVRGVGAHAVALPGSMDLAQVLTAPALHLARWNFTGGASG